MITKIITIGNSKGIRIPKILLQESGLDSDVKLHVKKGEIRITAAPIKYANSEDTQMLSEASLATDWNKSEEDKAWESLQ